MDGDAVVARLRELELETPSWGYGNSGTRFHVYPWPGAARDVWERVADAALVHRLTGCCPSVALHIPWDRVDDWARAPALRGGAGRAARRDQPERLRRGRLPARQPLQPGPGRPAARARPLPRVHRDRGRGRLRHDQPLARGRHELPGAGRPPRAARAAHRRARRALRRPAGGDAAARRVQVLRAGVLLAPISPTGAPRRSRAVGSARRRRCSSTPATTRRARTSSRSSPCSSPRGCSAASTSTAASTPTTT